MTERKNIYVKKLVTVGLAGGDTGVHCVHLPYYPSIVKIFVRKKSHSYAQFRFPGDSTIWHTGTHPSVSKKGR